MGDYYCLGGPPGAEIGVLREAVHLPSSRFYGSRSSAVEFCIQRSRKTASELISSLSEYFPETRDRFVDKVPKFVDS